ncbi:hypothetical protein KCU87_g17, partial [Aureobasidium melanogenum]
MYIAQGKKSQVYLDGEPPSDIIITFYPTMSKQRHKHSDTDTQEQMSDPRHISALSLSCTVGCPIWRLARFVWPDTLMAGSDRAKAVEG